MAKKVLIVYGTRYGATESTSEEIAKVLRDAGIDTTLINIGREKVKDVSAYDMVIVGSGMRMGKWTGAAEDFLKKYKKELSQKKMAIFVSSAAEALMKYDKNNEELEKIKKQYLEDKAAQNGLNPISMVIFGGVWDYNKMSFIFRKTMSPFKIKIEEAGFKEVSPGLYDTRDWDVIRNWAKEIAAKV
ncbi:MAG: flavodoxin domain-containing protein [Dehalococcoidales bacterium]|nr:flavodoxin domain-containing protein [Dehalococcoidales bacterium]